MKIRLLCDLNDSKRGYVWDMCDREAHYLINLGWVKEYFENELMFILEDLNGIPRTSKIIE
jgi:hypothetical protein